MMEETFQFEQGPIRPPSEAESLLVRFTRNCSWNRCAFCHTYRDTRFQIRSVAEIKSDIDAMRRVADRIWQISRDCGEGGTASRDAAARALRDPAISPEGRQVVFWLMRGGNNVFIQDANSPMMRTDQFVEALQYLKESFPKINRVTSYVRSATLHKKSIDDIRAWKEAGLTRVHVGLESGCDKVLDLIEKGATAEIHVSGGRKAIEAGLELSEYVIPGLGGRELWREHAIDTAKTLNLINPHFIRLRSLAIVPGTSLDRLREEGRFEKGDDELIAAELRLFIENLAVDSQLVSDHILNLFEEIEGKMPEAKPEMLALLERFFALPDRDRKIFILGRRAGGLRRLEDLDAPGRREQFEQLLDRIEADGLTIEDAIDAMLRRYI